MRSAPIAAMVAMLLTVGNLIAPVVTQAPAIASAPSSGRSFQQDLEFLYLNTSLMHLAFNKSSNGGIESIMDPTTGIELRTDRSQAPLLFQVGLRSAVGNNRMTVTNLDATGFSYQGCDGCQTLGQYSIEMHFANFSVELINVDILLWIKDGDPRSYWRGSVSISNASWYTEDFRYPVISGLTKDIGNNGIADTLAVPKYSGELFADPQRLVQPPINGDLIFEYPNELSMGFMALYDETTTGLLMEFGVTESWVKRFFLDQSGSLFIGMGYTGAIKAQSLINVYAPGVLAFFHGDWYTAADNYGTNAPAAATGNPISIRTDMPEWALTPAPMVTVHRTNDSGIDKVLTEQWSEVVSAFKALTGTNVTLHVVGWEQNGTYTGPYYLPPKDGDLAVKTEVKEVLAVGGHVMFSTSASIWRLKVPLRGYDETTNFDAVGLPYAVMNASGSPTHDERADSMGMPAVTMDPITTYWHDMDVSVSKGVANEVVDIQELQDMPYGAFEPCYNPSHSHQPGYIKQTTEANQLIMSDSFKMARSVNPDFILTTEGPSELLLNYAQAYRAGDNAPERSLYLSDMKAYGNAVSTAPMFEYKHHSQITSYGTPVPIGGTDMPGLYNASARAIARAFVYGQALSVSTQGVSTGNQKLSALYAREAKMMATVAREYMWLGKMARPPAIQTFEAEIPYRLDPREGHEGAGWGKDRDSQVLASAWRDQNGQKLGVAMVNWGNNTLDVGMMLQAYGLPDQDYSIVLNRNGERSIMAASVKLPHSMAVTMGPRDAVFIEVLHGADVVVEDMTADPASVIVGGTVNISVSVANRGSIGIDNVHLQLFENESYMDTASIGTLAPDTNATIPFTWSSAGKPLGTYNLTARVWPFYDELSKDNNNLSTIVSVLPIPRGTVSCAVVDNSTKGSLSGATVTLYDILNGTSIAEGLSISNKDVIFQNILPGTYGLNVTKNGYITYDRTDVAVMGKKTTFVTVYMDLVPVVATTGDLIGFVVDNATKSPLKDVSVVLIGTNLSYITHTDGMFTFIGLDIGAYSLSLTRTDYVGRNVNVNVTAGNTTYVYINLTAKPPPIKVGDIVGTIQDDKTHLPIPDAVINLTYTGGGQGLDPMEMASDAMGAFQFTDVLLGTYMLNATAKGYIGKDVPMNVSIEGVNLINVELKSVPQPPPPAVKIKGFLTDSKNQPVVNAEITALGPVQVSTFSSVSGYYELHGLKTGTFVINITADGYYSVAKTVSPTAGGDLWLNVTMERKPKTTAVGPETTYLLVGLNLLMLIGIIVIVATGRKRPKEKKRPISARKLKKAAVTRVDRPVSKSEEE